MLYLAICVRLLYAVVMLQIVTVHIYITGVCQIYSHDPLRCPILTSKQHHLLAIMVLHMVYLCYSTRMSKDMLHCNVPVYMVASMYIK